MTEQEILAMLARLGAVITDSHIVYTSKKHGKAYVDFRRVYPHTRQTSDLCRALALKFAEDGIEAVVAPEKNGFIISQWVAYHLSEITGREVLAFVAEKAEKGFVIKRGDASSQLPGKKVLAIDDVGTTGGSLKETIEALWTLGAYVTGAGFFCNRGGITSEDLVHVSKLVALTNIPLDAWEPEECPLCRQGVPINTAVGHGEEYLASLPDRGAIIRGLGIKDG